MGSFSNKIYCTTLDTPFVAASLLIEIGTTSRECFTLHKIVRAFGSNTMCCTSSYPSLDKMSRDNGISICTTFRLRGFQLLTQRVRTSLCYLLVTGRPSILHYYISVLHNIRAVGYDVIHPANHGVRITINRRTTDEQLLHKQTNKLHHRRHNSQERKKLSTIKSQPTTVKHTVFTLTSTRSEDILNDPSDAPTDSIFPSDANSRVATPCDTFSTCETCRPYTYTYRTQTWDRRKTLVDHKQQPRFGA